MEYTSVLIAIAVMALVVDSIGVLVGLIQLVLNMIHRHEGKKKPPVE